MSDFKDITLGQTLVHVWPSRTALSAAPTTIAGTLTYKLIIDGAWNSPIAQANINGVTLTPSPNSNPSLGVGLVINTTSNANGHWKRAKHYVLVVGGTTVDGTAVADVEVEFGIEWKHEPGRVTTGDTGRGTPGSNTFQLSAADTPSTTDSLIGGIIRELSTGQEREITSNDGTTGVCGVTPPWSIPLPATPRYNRYSGYAGLSAAQQAAAFRDLDNSAPAANSVGEAINTAAAVKETTDKIDRAAGTAPHITVGAGSTQTNIKIGATSIAIQQANQFSRKTGQFAGDTLTTALRGLTFVIGNHDTTDLTPEDGLGATLTLPVAPQVGDTLVGT